MPSGRRSFTTAPAISLRGARVHNLQDITLEIPRDRFVVLTGVSGSGKSSLAFDTIFAEGQRRYIECLSSSARMLLDQLERPDVDLIEGLPPTIAIDQRAGQASPRSTVGTLTEIHDYLRVLFARLGTPHCPSCGLPIHRQTPEQMVSQVLALSPGRKVLVLSPLVRGRKGQHQEVFQAIRRAGLIRARVDGEVVEVTEEPPTLSRNKPHYIEAVVDRLVIRDGIRPRLAESINLALKLSEGVVVISSEAEKGWADILLSIHLACPSCGVSLHVLEPRGFSFNSPFGACQTCEGLGTKTLFIPDLVIPDRSKSLDKGAVVPWSFLPPEIREGQRHSPALLSFLQRHRLDGSSPLDSWPPDVLDRFLEGEPDQGFPGLLTLLEQIPGLATRASVRSAMEAFRESAPCFACRGSRLREEALAVRFEGRTIHELSSMAIGQLKRFFETLSINPDREPIARPLIREITGRLGFLQEVGVGYLTLGRGSDTLSGGELQRARLATQFGAGLVGVCYILDEPTAGLHPRDTNLLMANLRRLQHQGNSVIVVEHDEAVIRAADWVIDLGPGAGPDGGRIVAASEPDRLAETADSITGRYLRQQTVTSWLPRNRAERAPDWIVIRNATVHNLKSVNARIPHAALSCVTGVSGSGKSSLIRDVLAREYRLRLRPTFRGEIDSRHVEGLDRFETLIEVDQSPIGRSPRATPSTYTSVFDQIRRVFAATRQAKMRGYTSSRFSFNAKGGRCESCEGLGRRRVPMQFLPDLYVTCEECQGLRFNRQTLEVRFKGKSIGEVLELRVDEARSFFEAHPRVLQGLESLHDVGLGYLTLGQSSTTLSGGEAQRIKLAAALGRARTGNVLYILDEPTTGLHFADIDRLLTILHRLAEQGNTLIVIEHNLDVIATADWVIDLGPEGGDGGGNVVAMGPPSSIAAAAESRTGAYLRTKFDLSDHNSQTSDSD